MIYAIDLCNGDRYKEGCLNTIYLCLFYQAIRYVFLLVTKLNVILNHEHSSIGKSPLKSKRQEINLAFEKYTCLFINFQLPR